MDNDKISEIEKRLKNTTIGKWHIFDNENDDDDICIVSENQDGEQIYICQTTYDNQSSTQKHNVVADSEFISHAKEDIEFLLSLISEKK